ncbi:MAG: ABC transporter permease [Candidatus Bathyarchaeia archaeon]
MNLLTYVIRRLCLMIFVLFGVLVITFFVSHVIPADPVTAALGSQAPAYLIEKVRHEWGLDLPLQEQFFNYLWNALHGDLGISIRTSRPVAEDLLQYFPATIELSTAAIILAVALSIPLGIISAVRRNKLADHITRIFSIFGISMPVFWLGLLLLAALYFKLRLMPSPGQLSFQIVPPPRVTGFLSIDSLLAGDLNAFFNYLSHLILPAFVLGFASLASITRITRSSMLEVLRQDYIRTARAKGLSSRVVINRHALKNALIPTTTVIGLRYGSLLEGAVLTETIFAWPGVGQYAVGAILFLDFPAIMGSVLAIAVVYSIANLIVDLVYGFLDPRMRVGD